MIRSAMQPYEIFTKLLNLGYDRFCFSGEPFKSITCELKKPGEIEPSIVAVGAYELHALLKALRKAQKKNAGY